VLGASGFVTKPVNWALMKHELFFVMRAAENERLAREARDSALRLAATKEQILNIARHELRTPLARIISQLENLESGETHSERTREYLRNLRSDATQMADLIHSLLLLAQSTNEERFTSIRRLDEMLFDAFEQAKKFAPTLQIRFEIDLEEGTEKEPNLEVQCNEALLLQALINLLRNADLYSDDHVADVHLKQLDEHYLCLRISNNGPTLTEKEASKIFDAFMRGHNARRKQGSGLGLRITHRIMQYHDASIRYIAEGKKKNVFEIIMPVYRA
jgi:signal transduction histidine kinase